MIHLSASPQRGIREMHKAVLFRSIVPQPFGFAQGRLLQKKQSWGSLNYDDGGKAGSAPHKHSVAKPKFLRCIVGDK
jgi:hypothetical protein